MNNQLSQVERDVVLESVEKNGSPWIIQAKGSSNRIFIPQGKATVHARNILFIPHTAVSQDVFAPITGIDCAVFFFYGGRGMFFSSRAQRTAQGTAFIIAPAIWKQDDQPHQASRFTAKLYYNGLHNATSVLFCESSSKYPLFNPYTWQQFSKTEAEQAHNLLFEIADLTPVTFRSHSPAREVLELSHRILYLPEHALPAKNYFPFEAGVTADDVFASELSLIYKDARDNNSECFIPLSESSSQEVHTVCAMVNDSPVVSPFEILRTTLLLPGIRFLIEKEDTAVESVLGRQHPLDILYLTESKILLGSRQQDTLLSYGSEFPLAMYTDCGPIQREMTGTVKITQRYDYGNRYIAVGNLLQLKEEDKRFLFEKLYPTPYV